MTKSKITVIGIGSPFGADQLGWQIIEELSQQPLLNSNNRFNLMACDRPGTLLLEHFKQTDRAVLIDTIEGGLAGNIRVVDKSELIAAQSLQSSHQLGVAETIALGKQLHLLPDELVLIGVETGNVAARYNPDREAIKNLTESIFETISEFIETAELSQH